MMNFSDVINTFKTPYEITVYKDEGGYIDGHWQPSTDLIHTIRDGAVQPLTDEELEIVPEGYRQGKSYKFYIPSKYKIELENYIYYRDAMFKILAIKEYNHIGDYSIVTGVEVQR